MNLLIDLGIDRREAYYAIEAFGDVHDPRRIRAGQEFDVAYEVLPPVEQGSAADERRLLNLSMRTAPDREIVVEWDAETEEFVSEARDIQLTERFTRGRGEIDSSLYMATNAIGVPDAVVVEMIRIFSHSVDFQRDIREGDSFDVFYSHRYDEEGEPVMNGEVSFASLVTRGREQRLYRFTTPDDGDTDFYDEDGKSVRAFLMRTPIDGARISSSFGPRRHPVLGYNRMHKGVDFAAPTGTPIYAAGNGTVVRASRYGSYGNYVRIRHANGYETAYAHLNGYGPGIRSGVRVEQGQVIGYVGATGRVTGAHLHYEVLYNDEQVNPRTIDLPSGRQLEGEILTAFQEERARIEAEMALAPTLELSVSASANGAGDMPGVDLAPE
jgi:murein DD-endopeptidase MepM/ murein hydrolase activator NlpD